MYGSLYIQSTLNSRTHFFALRKNNCLCTCIMSIHLVLTSPCKNSVHVKCTALTSHFQNTSWLAHVCKLAYNHIYIYIRESEDSTCRDGACADAIDAILKQKPYSLTTNTLSTCLSTQLSSLSTFMIKTHRVFQSLTKDS